MSASIVFCCDGKQGEIEFQSPEPSLQLHASWSLELIMKRFIASNGVEGLGDNSPAS